MQYDDSDSQVARILTASLVGAAILLLAGGCGSSPDTSSLIETGWSPVATGSFDDYHSPIPDDPNAFLLLGAVPVTDPDRDLPSALTGFLGRWEGYDLAPPVARDTKIVLVVTRIDEAGGTAVLWSGTDLQVPADFREIRFAVIGRDSYRIRWDAEWEPSAPGGRRASRGAYELELADDGRLLTGFADTPTGHRELSLERGDSFVTYRDYDQYLAGLGISSYRYTSPTLREFGDGWLVYLPPGYDEDPDRTWPLIYFLHGYGDTGRELSVLAKASPFMFIRQGHTLDAVIVAPALRSYDGVPTFPMQYVTQALEHAMERYRVDPARITVTGLSMGGDASFRLALLHPDLIAAAAPLCFGDPALNAKLRLHGYPPFPHPYTRAIAVPFWIIQGANDPVIPPAAARRTAERMRNEGLSVRLSILEEHDHDCWTSTYSDPEFYRWLLSW